jgi:hypothetical protein
MGRGLALTLIASVLAAFGLWQAFSAIAMVGGPGSPLVLLALIVQSVLALLAAVGVWQRRHWAAAALFLLGVSIAATALIYAFVLGIVAWLYALFVAIAAIAVALLLGAFVERSHTPSRGESTAL